MSILDNRVRRVLRARYRPHQDIDGLVRCLTEAFLEVSGVPWVRVHLEKPQPMTVSSGRVRPDAGDRPTEFEIRYRDRRLGGLELDTRNQRTFLSQAQQFARTLAFHVMRHEASRLAWELHQHDIAIIGTSSDLARADLFLEGAADSSLPALLVGAPGSKIARFGVALHVLGPRRALPLLQVHCGALGHDGWNRRFLDLLHRASGGTLLLSHLEELHPSGQQHLLQILEVGVPAWLTSQRQEAPEVRILACTHPDPERPETRKRIDSRLMQALDFLHLELAPLRRRRHDILPLMLHFHSKYRVGGGRVGLSDEVVRMCAAYSWPGDLRELERLVARLAVLYPGDTIGESHLRTVAPEMFHDSDGSPGRMSDERSVTRLLSGRAPIHPTLRRAVAVISKHPEAPLTLKTVAVRANVSSSHLAHLFRRELGTTFTRVLTHLRVQRAKSFLRQDPWRPITRLAEEAGFKSLRQFERTFKGLVGQTPAQYRRRLRSEPPHPRRED